MKQSKAFKNKSYRKARDTSGNNSQLEKACPTRRVPEDWAWLPLVLWRVERTLPTQNLPSHRMWVSNDADTSTSPTRPPAAAATPAPTAGHNGRWVTSSSSRPEQRHGVQLDDHHRPSAARWLPPRRLPSDQDGNRDGKPRGLERPRAPGPALPGLLRSDRLHQTQKEEEEW